MTRDEQVRELFSLLSSGVSLGLASLKTGMDEKTARRYRRAGRMPSELSEDHHWRTRVDPFSAVWEVVEQKLAENPGLQAKVLFAWLQGEYPGQFQNGHFLPLALYGNVIPSNFNQCKQRRFVLYFRQVL